MRTRVGNHLSEPIEPGAVGAPQGSILGCLIFLLYTNDMPGNRTRGTSIMYVDDDLDLASQRNTEELQKDIQHQALSTTNWLASNCMSISPEKSKLLVISTKQTKAKEVTIH